MTDEIQKEEASIESQAERHAEQQNQQAEIVEQSDSATAEPVVVDSESATDDAVVEAGAETESAPVPKPPKAPITRGDRSAAMTPASSPDKGGRGGGDRGERKGGGFGGDRRGGDRGRGRDEGKVDDGIKTKLVAVNRITKVVKGGRNMRFSALVVAGDQKGRVGIGTGKAAEVPEAVRKAEGIARRNMVKIALNEITIPHELHGKFGKSVVMLKPAVEGSGIKAGASVRAVVELAGVRNITTKMYGSRNPINAVKATFEGLTSIRSPEHIARLRGKTVEEIIG